ncbi:hypothetical protein K458DRAFT_478057, partial [Lentithecium fluviatile CBS 122367]
MAQLGSASEIVELGKVVFALIITLLILSWVTVGLRLWVRLRITRAPGWDDATMLFTLVLFTCYCAFILVITCSSAQSRVSSAQKIRQSLVYIQLGGVFYILTTTFLKISLGLFFLRLLTKPWQVRLFYIILGISAGYGLYYFFETIFHCGNPARLGDALLGSKKCAPAAVALTSGYIYGVINVLADWTFTLIPIAILLDSDMDRRSKISVGIVMGFAAIGSISSILRMVYLKGLLIHGSISANSVRATIWATAEPGTGIIAASVAILRPLFRQIASDVREKMSEYGSGKGSFATSFTTRQSTKHDPESVIALTSVGTTRGTDNKTKSVYSLHSEDPWDERISMERAQVGVGRMVSITVAAGDGVRPVPPPKDPPRRR